MTTGQRIKSLREQQGMTLAQVSQKVGVSEATIQRYESGDIRNIPIDRINAIAKALCVSSAALLGMDEDHLDPEIRLMARDLQNMSPAKREKAIAMLRLLMSYDEDR